MEGNSAYGDILRNNTQLGALAMHRIKHVEKPTNVITENIQRIDARETAFSRAMRGDYGPAVQREAPRSSNKYPLNVSLSEIRQYIGAAKANDIAPSVAPIPNDPNVLTRHIKRLGYFLGADLMGVCRLQPSAVYSHDMQGNPIDVTGKFAIVIVMAKDYTTTEASNGRDWINTSLSYILYQRLAALSQTLANYIRRLGFPASAEHTGKTPGGPKVLFPPLLLWSGIGEVSRAGIILNPFLGMNFKAAVVLTDMPMVPDRPVDFGLQDFCERCKICSEFCPGSAIPTGSKTMYNGYETWKLNEQRCHSFRVLNKRGSYCGRCIKVCPWTRPDNMGNGLVRWAVQRSGLARRIAVKIDRSSGRDKARSENKWWFDIEDVDGILTPASVKDLPLT